MNPATTESSCRVPRHGISRPAITALLFVGVVLAVPGSAQRVQADETFEEELTILEVEVPVQVVRDGEPVGGLGRDDFTVTYRGEPVDIVSFDAVDLSVQRGGGISSQRPAEAAAPAPASSSARSILMLFDFQYSNRGLVGRSVEKAGEMLDLVHPSDRLAVAMMGGRRGAQLVTGFTVDRERTRLALDLVQAVADAKPKRQRRILADLVETTPPGNEGLAREYGVSATVAFGEGLSAVSLTANPAVNVDAAVELAGAADTGDSLAGGAAEVFRIGQRLSQFDQTRQLVTYAEALGNLGTLLGGVEGQKYALLFSQGPPLSLLEMTTVSSDPAVPGNASEGTALANRALRDAFGQLVRAGWHIHALSQGMRPAAMGGSSGSVDQYVGSQNYQQALIGRRDGGGVAFLMADETGGKAYLNRALPPVDEFLERTSVSYVLRFVVQGYEAGGKGKEPFTVALTDPALADAQLAYRDFFYPPKLPRQRNQVEALIADAETRIREQTRRAAEQIEFAAIAFADPSDPGVLWITAHLPRSQLRRTGGVVEDATVRWGIVAGLGSEDSRVVLDQAVTLQRGTLLRPPAQGVTFVGRAELDPEELARVGEARVAVELGVGGATLRLPVQRWTPGAGATGVVGPLFLPSGLERLVLRSATDEKVDRVPLTAPNGQELVPLPFAEIAADEQVGVILWTAEGEDALPGEAHEFRLERRSGALRLASHDLRFERRTVVDGAALWFATLDASVLDAGNYRLVGPGVDHRSVGTLRVLPPPPSAAQRPGPAF